MKLLVITTGKDGGYVLFEDKKIEAYGPSSIMRDYDSFSEIVISEWKPDGIELVTDMPDANRLERQYWRDMIGRRLTASNSFGQVAMHYGFELGNSKQMRSIARKLPCCRMTTISRAPYDGEVMAILAGWMEVGGEKK